MTRQTIPFAELGRHDVASVGGKNSSLGEMIANLAALGVQVPGGFATTADAYREFLAHDGLAERIRAELATLDVEDVTRLAATGAKIRGWILATPFPTRLQQAIESDYAAMCEGGVEASVAVRSSATAEDLPGRSFAGQYDSYLGVLDPATCMDRVKDCWASLWSDRAFEYRRRIGIEHLGVRMAVIVQAMGLASGK